MAPRVLIYRQGTLGDTIVALPALNLIKRSFPDSERLLLTDVLMNAVAAPAASVAMEAGLVDGAIEYRRETRSLGTILGLIGQVRRWRPEIVIYLVEARTRLQRIRDMLFLKACGARKIYGLNILEDMSNRRLPGTDVRESEAARLARAVKRLGDARPDLLASWDLGITEQEDGVAVRALGEIGDKPDFITFSIGTKWPTNDYEDANWTELLDTVSKNHPDLALVAIGAPSEFERSRRLLERWDGKTLNLCGKLKVRESAALLRLSMLFIGHDSGPMHLASSVGTPCVAIFSARNQPGIWFPRGDANTVFYNKVDCAGCGLATCVQERKRCILSILPGDVAAACTGAINAQRHEAVRSA